MKRAVTVLAHRDLDGLLSTLCFALSDEYAVVYVLFVRADDVISTLQANKEWLADRTVLILDLQIGHEELQVLRDVTADFFIIDHHVNTKEITKETDRSVWAANSTLEGLETILSPKELLRLDTIEPISCSNLCYSFNSYTGLPAGSLAKLFELVQHTRVVDTGIYVKTKNRNSLNFSKLCDRYGVESYYNRVQEIVCSNADYFNSDENSYLSMCSLNYEQQLARIRDIGISMIAPNCRVYMFTANTDMSELSEEFTGSFDVVVAVNAEEQRVTMRTQRGDLNLGDFVKRFFNGGGHQKCAGFALPELERRPWGTIFQLFAEVAK